MLIRKIVSRVGRYYNKLLSNEENRNTFDVQNTVSRRIKNEFLFPKLYLKSIKCIPVICVHNRPEEDVIEKRSKRLINKIIKQTDDAQIIHRKHASMYSFFPRMTSFQLWECLRQYRCSALLLQRCAEGILSKQKTQKCFPFFFYVLSLPQFERICNKIPGPHEH